MRMRTYAIVTGAYWAFTVSDGALRMLVLLRFHDLGYSAVAIAFLFLLYEAMGVATNLGGGWLGARSGLNHTLVAGLTIQVGALLALTLHTPRWSEWVSVAFVMGVQALSGVAKDLTKMSSKSAVKLVAGEGKLFRLVALLTGSKNGLKGVGFFVGAALLSWVGYDAGLVVLAVLVGSALAVVLVGVGETIGKAKESPSVQRVLSPSSAINRLSAARTFLFGARDVWFVVALPVFFAEALGWSHESIGAFLAAWVIGYGLVQSAAPAVVERSASEQTAARVWITTLLCVAAALAIGVSVGRSLSAIVIVGVMVFGVVFAVNSSLHSYLVLAYSTSEDEVALDVGFYYAANAVGRLGGTLLSGVLYLAGGLEAALWGSAVLLAVASLLTLRLPPVSQHATG